MIKIAGTNIKRVEKSGVETRSMNSTYNKVVMAVITMASIIAILSGFDVDINGIDTLINS